MGIFDDLGLAGLIADTVDDLGLGAQVIFTSTTPGTYDPATGSATPTTGAETVSGIVEDPRGFELLTGLAQAGDKLVSIPAASLTATPKPTDTVEVNGQPFTVVRVENDQAGETVVLHVLHCRSA